ncbi:F-box/kelch-repeat protein [Vitis vinifera]|uniref:F-box/kelch-repeat protein n=1 Tax=Vitis vinifera TaxID=29760 RepID=A0A438JHJ5_VITVI|nr:F-box/kelch-repeat protein [Vitis vinifera]
MATDVSQWKEMLDNSMSGNFILSENLVDVLLRLPVKSIIRFKCVCQSWQTLFNDPDFINMHLRRAITHNNCCMLLKYLSSSEEEVYSLRCNKDFAEFRRLQVPVPSKTDYYHIVGSSNGLICLTESNNKGSYVTLDTFLWNPSVTDQRKPLPKYLINNMMTSPFMVVGLGFAFHPRIDDYKVVRIVYFLKSKTYEVHVYSLKQDAWKNIDANVHCHIHDTVSRTFVNGALHWLAAKKNQGRGKSDDLILSFDMVKDNLSEMILPEFGYDESLTQKCLADYKGLLSVLVYNAHRCNDNCDIWVMHEYSVASSWTKRFTFCLDVEILILLDFLDNGEVVVQNKNGGLVACDPNGGKIRDLKVAGPACLIKYIESLVSPRGGNPPVEQPISYPSFSTLSLSEEEIHVEVGEAGESSKRPSKLSQPS